MKAKATGETGADRPAAPYVAASAAAGELPGGAALSTEIQA